jgi:hypothetical protein
VIKLILGNVGSGKTLHCVRDIVINQDGIVTFSNIRMNNVPNNILIEPYMIFNKQLVKENKNGKKIFKWTLNEKYWLDAITKYGSINIVIDEAHNIFNARTNSSKINRIFANFLSLLRRVLGSSDAGSGTLTLITQLDRKIDVLAREMATSISWCKCYYKKTCKRCNHTWNENNEMPETLIYCPKCGANRKNIHKHSHTIEIWKFPNIQAYEAWKCFGRKSKFYYAHYLINPLEVEKYFPSYNTLQWDYLSQDIYSEMEDE